MEPDLDLLRLRLQQEEEHLDWFEKTGQRTKVMGIDTTEQYRVAIKARIEAMKRQIAAHSKSGA
jgi:hypothetical protein